MYLHLTVSTMHFNSKNTPTNDTNYSCHIKAVELVSPSYWIQITLHNVTNFQ